MAVSVTEILNIWNEMGVFSYVIPFLLIFAVVFAILEKSKILGDKNRPILAIVSVCIGLLALQFDFVSEFFAVIFPRFGVGLSVFLVLLIMLGFFYPEDSDGKFGGAVSWIGWVVGIGVAIWALSSWDQWGYYNGFGGWFSENIWALIILGGLIAAIILMSRKKKKDGE